jgi:glycosyltransferase involved in cell wall biosynthesis
VIAGDGPLRESLEAQIARLGIGDRVKLLGYRSDVPNLLRTLDLFVLSSCEEGLGTSVLDAMVCRVPVVATVAGGIPEMVTVGETGSLVPSRDPEALAAGIIEALTCRDLAEARARRAEALVRERFSVDRMVEGNLRVYEELLAAP